MSFVFYLLIFSFLFLCFLTMFVILMQESKSMGLGASFGSDASTSLFGTATADVLKKFTAYLVIIFMVSCIFLSFWTSALARKSIKANSVIEEVQESITP